MHTVVGDSEVRVYLKSKSYTSSQTTKLKVPIKTSQYIRNIDQSVFLKHHIVPHCSSIGTANGSKSVEKTRSNYSDALIKSTHDNYLFILGHTAEFEVEEKNVRLSNIPNRPGTFILDNVHFHYGPTIGAPYSPTVDARLFSSVFDVHSSLPISFTQLQLRILISFNLLLPCPFITFYSYKAYGLFCLVFSPSSCPS